MHFLKFKILIYYLRKAYTTYNLFKLLKKHQTN